MREREGIYLSELKEQRNSMDPEAFAEWWRIQEELEFNEGMSGLNSEFIEWFVVWATALREEKKFNIYL